MRQRNDELLHQAELLLDLFGRQEAQKEHLQVIERELKRRGVASSVLCQRIDQLCTAQPDRGTDYRCHYELYAPMNQQALAEQLFDLSH